MTELVEAPGNGTGVGPDVPLRIAIGRVEGNATVDDFVTERSMGKGAGARVSPGLSPSGSAFEEAVKLLSAPCITCCISESWSKRSGSHQKIL